MWRIALLLLLIARPVFPSPLYSEGLSWDEDFFINRYQQYLGNFHIHSDASSRLLEPWTGIGNFDHFPADDIRTTIQKGIELNRILGLSDHSNCINSNEWDAMQNYIFGSSIHDFKPHAIRGFEWTNSAFHINVFGTDNFLAETGSLGALYEWLANANSIRSNLKKPIICQFNHPAKYQNFNSFELPRDGIREQIIEMFVLFEIGSGPNPKPLFYSGIDQNLPLYIQALKKGWRVCPAINCDNFTGLDLSKGNIQTGAYHRHTGIYHDMFENNGDMEAGFLEDLSNRIIFASEDDNASVMLMGLGYYLNMVDNSTNYLTIRMGGFAPLAYSSTIKFRLHYKDENGEGVRSVESYQIFPIRDFTFNGVIGGGGTFEFNLTNPFGDPHNPQESRCSVFAVLTQNDGDKLVSSPIWLTGFSAGLK